MRAIALVTIGVGLALSAIGCGPEPESCSTALTCSKGGNVQACCTSTRCRYKLSDGTSIDCSGTDCSSGSPSAAQKAADWCVAH